MTHLADTRPIVHNTVVVADDDPIRCQRIAECLARLLIQHPDLELASIRLIREDQRVHIAGRLGPIAQPVCNCYPGGFSPETYEGPQHHCPVHGHGNDLAPAECPACIAARECPSCHTTGDRPHTEYCQLVDHASQLTHAELEPNLTRQIRAARHGQLLDDAFSATAAEPVPWVDNGCRCPAPEANGHHDGCPANTEGASS